MHTSEGNSGLNAGSFLSVEEARRVYDLSERDSLFASPLDQELVERGIAKVALDTTEADFNELVASYEVCLEDYPRLLAQTFHQVDSRYGNEAGNVRKELKRDPATGIQIDDPKSYFHFNELAIARWNEQFTPATAPPAFLRFLAQGAEMHHSSIPLEQELFAQLEETHPNISRAYFPVVDGRVETFGFYRLVSYDAYDVTESLSTQVGKEHADIAGMTLQQQTDAPGFCAIIDGQEVPFDSEAGFGYWFPGNGHEKLYGGTPRLRALRHKVNRIIPEGITHVPKRHAGIKFTDAPFVDYQTNPKDILAMEAALSKIA